MSKQAAIHDSGCDDELSEKDGKPSWHEKNDHRILYLEAVECVNHQKEVKNNALRRAREAQHRLKRLDDEQQNLLRACHRDALRRRQNEAEMTQCRDELLTTRARLSEAKKEVATAIGRLTATEKKLADEKSKVLQLDRRLR